MQHRDYHTLADPMDFCRECKGVGMVSFEENGRNISETCPSCGGNGWKTAVLISPTAHDAAQ